MTVDDHTRQIIAHLAAGDEDALEAVELRGDGHFQTRDTTLGELTRETVRTLRTGFTDRDALPTVVVGWGRCRTGSTALTNLMGVAGVPAYYQPVKTVVRHRVLDLDGAPWRIDRARGGTVFCKEMAGPYTLAETLLNPIRCLLAAGYPADRLHLVVLDREPHASMDSWVAKWSARLPADVLLRHYLLATLSADRMRRFARDHGVPVTTFPYEAAQWPLVTVPALFDRLGVGAHYRPEVVQDWGGVGDLNSADCRISFPPEPDAYVLPGVHGSFENYHFRPRTVRLLGPAHRDVIAEFGLTGLFREALRRCADDLALDATAADRLTGAEPVTTAAPTH
jgi:hypothetical protein